MQPDGQYVTNEINVLSLQTTGLHRTQTKWKRKNNQTVYKRRMRAYNRRVFRIGAGVFIPVLITP
jgi:hypothetical protein